MAAAVVVSPLLAGLFLAVAGKREAVTEEQQIVSGERRRCPHCAELIRWEAIVCKHCGRDLPAVPAGERRPWTCTACGITCHDDQATSCLNCGQARP
jgi:hypothetical protein